LEGFFTPPERERRLWELDQKIGERGIPVDPYYVASASLLAAAERERLLQEMKTLTGLENPNSVPQLTEWLVGQGYGFNSLGAAKVKAALEENDGDCVSV
jgi:DNA polymerase